MYGYELSKNIIYGMNYITAEQINEIYVRYDVPFQIKSVKEFDELNTYLAENFSANDGESSYQKYMSDVSFQNLCAMKVMFKSKKQYFYFLHLVIEFSKRKGEKNNGI